MLCAFLVSLLILPYALALPAASDTIEPAVYLNFNEGSGLVALDASGHGSAGSLHNVSRIASGGCGGAVLFDPPDSYISIPYRPTNHPEKAVTVSAWFFTDSFEPQDLVSTCHNGGYCLGFGDGNDLWWTVNTWENGPVSVNIRHDGITPGQWHHVAGLYDGKSVKVYLDGILRNSVNASGPIVYADQNYVILGARAGPSDMPDMTCPRWFHGGLDEVRIYDQAVPYAQIMDDRFRCSQDSHTPLAEPAPPAGPGAACLARSGELTLPPGSSVVRTLTFTGRDETAGWTIVTEPGATLMVDAIDQYPHVSPDSWYVEIADRNGRIDRSIAFPNTRNTPVDGMVPDGNATVFIRHFDGSGDFPATVQVRFAAAAPPPKPPEPPKTILNYPIIVIYSASWATLIALVVVFLWLHKRRKERMMKEKSDEKKDS